MFLHYRIFSVQKKVPLISGRGNPPGFSVKNGFPIDIQLIRQFVPPPYKRKVLLIEIPTFGKCSNPVTFLSYQEPPNQYGVAIRRGAEGTAPSIL
jgi:hypothetical protein